MLTKQRQTQNTQLKSKVKQGLGTFPLPSPELWETPRQRKAFANPYSSAGPCPPWPLNRTRRMTSKHQSLTLHWAVWDPEGSAVAGVQEDMPEDKPEDNTINLPHELETKH